MWIYIVRLVIRYRLPLIITIGLITVFMGYHASKAHIAHQFISTLPSDDPEQIQLANFRKQFGEDGSVVAIGLKDSSLFSLQNFKDFQLLCEELKQLSGVTGIISLPQMKRIKKDTINKQFVFTDIFPHKITDQQQLDSLLKEVPKYKFYAGQIMNVNNGAIAALVTIDSMVLNSAENSHLIDSVMTLGNSFSSRSNITLHYAGIPVIRAIITSQLGQELKIFLFLSVVITSIVLFLFFRSFRVVLIALIVIGTAVIWSVAAVALLDYRLTLLSGMIPPIMVVIGIPNTIYLINKYHIGYQLHGGKILAVSRVVQRVGMATFLTNLTTAIGFLVLLSTNISILREFGIVAGLNVLTLFVISLILIPGLLSWIAPPSTHQTKHLNVKFFDTTLLYIDKLVHKKRGWIYVLSLLVMGIATVGITKLNTLSYMADDMPRKSQIKKDLSFFEENFSGVMPLEIVMNTNKRRGVLKIKNLKKIEEFERFVSDQPYISQPISLIGFIKSARQAFYNDNPARYALPSTRDQPFILRYMKSQMKDSALLKSFVDPKLEKMRISYRMADIGSHKMDSLVSNVIKPKMSAFFADTPITGYITGTTPVFVQGNKFLISNLRYSLLLAFGIIAIVIGFLFSSIRMVIVSLIPNFIPMIITISLMGYLDIALKPSTVLIFSIIFGISIDFSIHFLAKYYQEINLHNYSISKAISVTILEVGKSMIYTSIVLFSGFIIFAFSSFGGTISLGLLTSTTLAMSMVTNLTILPALIITFNYKKYKSTLSTSSAIS